MSSLPDVSLKSPSSSESSRPGERDLSAVSGPQRVSDLKGDLDSAPEGDLEQGDLNQGAPKRGDLEGDLEQGDLNQGSRVTSTTEVTKLPDSDLKGDRITVWERASVLVRHWCQQATQVTPAGGVLDARPESLAQYRTYVRSRAWLPEGYDRGWLLWVTVAYYNTLGLAGLAIGSGIAWVFARMLRFNVAVTVAAVSVALWRIFG